MCCENLDLRIRVEIWPVILLNSTPETFSVFGRATFYWFQAKKQLPVVRINFAKLNVKVWLNVSTSHDFRRHRTTSFSAV